MSSTQSVNHTFRSPAKVNLFLKVTGKRTDGYHELETLFLPLETPADEIVIHARPAGQGLSLGSTMPELPLDQGNICWKAAAAWCAAAGVAPDFHIHIAKVVPVAAGLGGGSANAATVLLGLNRHYAARPLSPEVLAEIAVKIGADVPFFLAARPAVARGIGEQLDYLDFDPAAIPILVVAPDFPVSAAWAYRHLDPAAIGPAPGELDRMLEAIRSRDWQACGRLLRNDLAAALFDKFPLLTMLRDDLLAGGACGATVSGSGPSLFAVCPDRNQAETLAGMLQEKYGNSLRSFVSGGR